MSRWNGPRGGGSSGGGGGGGPTIPAASNETGGALAKGTVVGADSTGPLRVQPFDATDAGLPAARIVGLVTQDGGIANGATGEVSIVAFDSVLFKNGLAPAPADGGEFYASTTPGRMTTLADLVANPPPQGGVVHRMGVIMDASAYAADTPIPCVFYPGQRREQV